MELAEQITSRVAELAGEVELPRKQLDGAECELEWLEIAGQVITTCRELTNSITHDPQSGHLASESSA